MAFVSMMDDSSPEKIRKSIFIFASIIVFSLLYKLEVTAPNSLFSSASEVGEGISNIKITYQVIVAVLAAFQCYLIARLYLSWRISKAKFTKFWIVDEFDDREDKSDLLNELDTFHKYCKDHPYPQDLELNKLEKLLGQIPQSINDSLEQIDTVSSALVDSKNSWSKLREDLMGTNKLLRTLIADQGLLTDSEQQKLLNRFPHIERVKPDAKDPKFVGDLYDITSQFIEKTHEIEKGELKNNLNRLKDITGSVSLSIEHVSNKLGELNVLYDRYCGFVETFPQSIFRQAIDVKPSDLNKAKRMREVELDFFDFWLPLIVAGISIVFSVSPYCEDLDSSITVIREALGIVK